jgi:hypothetical protein
MERLILKAQYIGWPVVCKGNVYSGQKVLAFMALLQYNSVTLII